MTAADALGELMEVSAQVRCAFVLAADGTVIADSGVAGLDGNGVEVLRAADEAARRLGRPPVGQCAIELEQGAVFFVRDDSGRVALAVTDRDATAGLVFYDLRQVLRSLAEESV
jgi:predicted regulator of Ras-like GTPase activity (Roadblock/LC7/MglB family)